MRYAIQLTKRNAYLFEFVIAVIAQLYMHLIFSENEASMMLLTIDFEVDKPRNSQPDSA